MEICPVGDELFHVDGQTGNTNLIVASYNSVHSPNYDIVSVEFF